MGDDVLLYQSPKRQPGAGRRIAKMVVVLSLANLATLAEAVPTTLGRGSRPGFLMTDATYGWLGTFLRVTHRFFQAAPMTTSYEMFWRPFVANVMFLVVMWTGCIVYCRGINQRPSASA